MQRLHLSTPLSAGAELALDAARSHYVANVLRLRPGDAIKVFNARDGEWRAIVVQTSRRTVTLKAQDQTATPGPPGEFTLYAAPIRGDRWDTVIEKATELGVAAIQPVLTRRTVVRRINAERLLARATEAAEQCGRMDIPALGPLLSLEDLLTRLSAETPDGPVLWADEGDAGAPALAAHLLSANRRAHGILIGPEGGFAPEERQQLAAHPAIQAVSLGRAILRADTAAYVGLALMRALPVVVR
jgi:16S rRNA (uracil1498-N3)-methyltransferase